MISPRPWYVGAQGDYIRDANDLPVASLRYINGPANARLIVDAVNAYVPPLHLGFTVEPHVHTPTRNVGDANDWCSTCGEFPL